mmetsp:Transcript_52780/g.96383  ORF Transcript_52780/g.96383 Transcript_52780/m.96383 type:complete len:225 (+) Transcript_52780:763-1437(+)
MRTSVITHPASLKLILLLVKSSSTSGISSGFKPVCFSTMLVNFPLSSPRLTARAISIKAFLGCSIVPTMLERPVMFGEAAFTSSPAADSTPLIMTTLGKSSPAFNFSKSFSQLVSSASISMICSISRLLRRMDTAPKVIIATPNAATIAEVSKSYSRVLFETAFFDPRPVSVSNAWLWCEPAAFLLAIAVCFFDPRLRSASTALLLCEPAASLLAIVVSFFDAR